VQALDETNLSVPPPNWLNARFNPLTTIAVEAAWIVQAPAPIEEMNSESPAANVAAGTEIVVAVAALIWTCVPRSPATSVYEVVLAETVWL
jgi:hypothetical protein